MQKINPCALAGALSCILLGVPKGGLAQGSASCASLQTQNSWRATGDIFQSISKSGCYVLNRSVINRPFLEQKSHLAVENLLEIRASNVTIDLAGREVIGRYKWTAGLVARHADRYANVRLENGTIVSRGAAAVGLTQPGGGPMISLPSDVNVPGAGLAERTFLRAQQEQPATSREYPATHHILQSLVLESEKAPYVAGIQGAGNRIVRNRIVAVDSHAGLYIMGPNNVIEDNVFIFKNYRGNIPSASPIKLFMSDGTIIRNNRFLIEQEGSYIAAAISIIRSSDVIIENNQVFGNAEIFKVWDDVSTVRSKNNELLHERREIDVGHSHLK